MSFKMVVSDLDATLLTKEKHISEKNIEAIRKAHGKGVIFVIATGRILRSAGVFAEIIGTKPPVAACNGAVLVDSDGTLLLEEYMSFNQIENIAKIADKYNQYYHFYDKSNIYTKFDTNRFDKYYNSGENPSSKNVSLKSIYNSIDELDNEKIKLYKALFISLDNEVLDMVEKDFSHYTNLSVTSSSRNNVEINKAGVSKGNAIKTLAERYGINRNEIIAIGDNRNDQSMLEFAGLGVAVENAATDTKALADIVTVSNEDSAVARIIEEYVL